MTLRESCDAATYVDKILKGTKPADHPTEHQTRFDLVVNLREGEGAGHHAITLAASGRGDSLAKFGGPCLDARGTLNFERSASSDARWRDLVISGPSTKSFSASRLIDRKYVAPDFDPARGAIPWNALLFTTRDNRIETDVRSTKDKSHTAVDS